VELTVRVNGLNKEFVRLIEQDFQRFDLILLEFK
jgi:hypothetical protein